jgi:hypothetical protein
MKLEPIVKNSDGTIHHMTHYEALEYCAKNNCRLPTLDELIGFYSGKNYVKTKDDINWFWSSSVYPYDPDYAYVFKGYGGGIDPNNRTYKSAVRVVKL